jgi:hypothetical protein
VIITTLLLSQYIFTAPLIGILKIHSIYLSNSICLIAILATMNSEPKERVSTMFCHLEYQMIGALLQNIIILVCDL